MKLDDNDPRVVSRSANRPRVSCNLMNSSIFSCDECRSLPPIPLNGVLYFCVAEYQEKRFWKYMVESKRTIQVGWANNYLLEKINEKTDNNEGCAPSGGLVQPTDGQPVDQMGVDGETVDGSSGEETKETNEVVGECYG